MGVKYVKNFSFPASGGFHAPVQRFAKGGHVTKVPAKAKASTKGVPAKAKPNAPARDMKPGKAPAAKRRYAEGGDVLKKIPPPSGREPMATENKFGRTPPLTVTPKQGATEEELAGLRDAIERNNPGRKPDPRDYALPVESAPLPPLSPLPPPPQETFGPAPLPPEEYARPVQDYPRLPELSTNLPPENFRPQFGLESQEQTNARLAADRGMRRQNRMDMVGGRGEMGRRRMPVPSPLPARMPVAQPASMVNPREAQMYAKGGKVGMDNYAGKTGPYRGSPKKARELGRQDRRAREAMERAEKHAPGLALDMKAKGGMPVHRRKPMYGGGKC